MTFSIKNPFKVRLAKLLQAALFKRRRPMDHRHFIAPRSTPSRVNQTPVEAFSHDKYSGLSCSSSMNIEGSRNYAVGSLANDSSPLNF
jgi:hypothetical protein